MVQYKCNKCGKIFDRKNDYNRHINRKTSCKPKRTTKSVRCEYCKKVISGKDNLPRHYDVCKKYQSNVNINADNQCTNNQRTNNPKNTMNRSTIGGNLNNGNISNNIVNNNINIYNVIPFGKEGIESLTTQDKIDILNSNDKNPIEIMTEKTNLNPELHDLHNVGYLDNKSGNGIVYDGNTWKTEKIKTITDQLLRNKGKDVTKIYDEIKDHVVQDDLTRIEATLIGVHQIMEPKTDNHVNDRKDLQRCIKNTLYNNKELAINSKKKYDELPKNKVIKKEIHPKQHTSLRLKDGLTPEDIDRQNKLKKDLKNKITIMREIINYLLDKLPLNSDESIKTTLVIKQKSIIDDPDILNYLINQLSLHIYLKEPLDLTKPMDSITKMIPVYLSKENKIENLKILIKKIIDNL
jgi:hypothetical protein